MLLFLCAYVDTINLLCKYYTPKHPKLQVLTFEVKG